ncbi:peptidase family C78-domain-containing protein [Halenospora varia]|nr:peptidase family C78-domain-containing protein [Halenospora varia]
MAEENDEDVDCPFLCGFKPDDKHRDYQMMLHIQTVHSEGGESPFVVKADDASIAAMVTTDDESQYFTCSVEGCGEALLSTELDSHIEMHGAEQESGDEDTDPAPKEMRMGPGPEASFDTKLSHALRNVDDGNESSSSSKRQRSQNSPGRHESAKDRWKKLLKIPEPPPKASSSSTSKGSRRRLGVSPSYLGSIHHQTLMVFKKSELGPHANEKQMPTWLVELLQHDGAMTTINRLDGDGKLKKVKFCPNRTSDILPVVEQLLRQDKTTEYAYLCHPAVRHVSKLKREGGFCGYRNIQMMASYIIGTCSQGYEFFNDKIPSIFDIQEYIESAWDKGINKQGRIETGGIRGTRKYIGTPDAQAMLIYLDIACEAQALKPKKDKADAERAYNLLFDAVETYFANGCTDFRTKVRCTHLPPIYFQHPGHSMTIVGFEKRANGAKEIIVFDPMFHDSPTITKLIGQEFRHKAPSDSLKAYRRGVHYLRKYNEFEILKLTPPRRRDEEATSTLG